jgi:hypothetical protein
MTPEQRKIVEDAANNRYLPPEQMAAYRAVLGEVDARQVTLSVLDLSLRDRDDELRLLRAVAQQVNDEYWIDSAEFDQWRAKYGDRP